MLEGRYRLIRVDRCVDRTQVLVLVLAEHLHLELLALADLEPQAQRLRVTVDVDPQMAGFADHAAAVTDLEHQRVQERDGVDAGKRVGLPRAVIVHDGVGDLRDQLTTDPRARDLLKVRRAVPG